MPAWDFEIGGDPDTAAAAVIGLLAARATGVAAWQRWLVG